MNGTTASRQTVRHRAPALCLLAIILLLGGGGSPSPWSEMVLELLAGCALCAWAWQGHSWRDLWPQDRLLGTVAVILLLLPALQLVPLPPELWHALPGRQVSLEALGLVGAADSWRPISLAPLRTIEALLSLGPPLAVLLMSGALGSTERRWLIAVVAAFALISALVGAAQLAGGAGALRLYEHSHRFGITGFQANRNAEADILLIGLVAIGTLAAGQSKRFGKPEFISWLALASGGVVALAVLFTGSRSGIALLPIALAAAWLAARPEERRASGGRNVAAGSALAGGATLLSLWLLLRWTPALGWVAARFDRMQDARLSLWADSLFAAGQFWPVGAGMGTFGQVILAAERLESVDPTLPNRAHNDYLELVIEAGLPGAVALAALFGLIGWMAVRAWRNRPQDRPQTVFGGASLLILGAHSCVDYPLRSMSVAGLAALAAGVISQVPKSARGSAPLGAADHPFAIRAGHPAA